MDLEEAKSRLLVGDVWRILRLPDPPTDPTKNCSGRSPLRVDEHAGSFSIYDGGRRWHDFATGEGGDAIDFLRVATGSDEREAIRELIKMAGGTVASRSPKLVKPAVSSQIEEALRNTRRTLPLMLAKLKRGRWPELRRGNILDWDELARLRGIDPRAVELASLENVLRFCLWKGKPCWAIPEEDPDEPLFLEIRRLDGKKWEWVDKDGKNQSSKTYPLKACKKRAVNLGNLCGGQSIALVEGCGDLLGAYHFIVRENRVADVLPVMIPGASISIPNDQLPIFAGRRVRIFAHDDEAGRNWANALAEQLVAVVAGVDSWELEGGDLNDLAASGYNGELMNF